MKLLSLGSHNPKFQNITFRDGLNIIVGTKRVKDSKETSNGVGKSLSIKLINYMLSGKDTTINKLLKETQTQLDLQFEHNNQIHQISRDGQNIFLNEKSIKPKELKEFLDDFIPDRKFSFRDMFVRFIRQAYTQPTMQLPTEDGFHNNLINAHLLHLNTEFIYQKRELHKKNETLTTLIKTLKELQYEIDKERMIEVEEQLSKIEADLQNFRIAEDYYEIEKEIEDFNTKIREHRNQVSIFERELRIREEIIKTNNQLNIDIDQIDRIYKEAKFFLGDSVIKHLNAVKEFHETLFKNRKESALKDIKIITKKIELEKKNLQNLDKERSKKLQYLEGRGALEEYHAMIKKRDGLLEELNRLKEKEQQIEQYTKEKNSLKLEIDTFAIKLMELKEEIKARVDEITRDFRQISSLFYKKPGYLEIEIVENMQAKRLYDIEPKIQADESSGIGMMKIFIYDMLLYRYNPWLVGFVAHDNLLFDVTDERQIATTLSYANDNLSQYICSMSDTKLDSTIDYIKENLSKKHHALIEILQDSVILSLSEDKKLFGIEF